jgi:hypothetical protein
MEVTTVAVVLCGVPLIYPCGWNHDRVVSRTGEEGGGYS